MWQHHFQWYLTANSWQIQFPGTELREGLKMADLTDRLWPPSKQHSHKCPVFCLLFAAGKVCHTHLTDKPVIAKQRTMLHSEYLWFSLQRVIWTLYPQNKHLCPDNYNKIQSLVLKNIDLNPGGTPFKSYTTQVTLVRIQVYKMVGISQIEEYERVGKSVILSTTWKWQDLISAIDHKIL